MSASLVDNEAAPVAIVTGSAQGIGAAVVRQLLTSGARVVGVDRESPAVDPALLTSDRDRLRAVVGDVGLESTAAEFTQVAMSAFGRIDILINNAGVACVKRIHEHSEADWDRVFNTNVKSLFWAAREVVPVMQRQQQGSIVNIGSISSVCGMPLQGAYGPSKGAVIQLTRQMAIEYAGDGIRVNAVCPGTVDTPLLQSAAVESGQPAEFLAGLASGHPIGRIASAEEIARFVCFIASREAGFVTGAILMVDGGFSAR